MKFEALYSKENSLILLALFGTLSIFPFAILRFISGEYLIGTIDLAISISTAIVGLYIYKTKEIKYSALLIVILCMLGSSVLVNIHGEPIAKWLYPIMISMFFVLNPKTTICINIAIIISVIPKLFQSMPSIEFFGTISTLLMVNLFVFVFAMRNDKQQKQMFKLAWFDSLTGIRNRRSLDQKFNDIDNNNKPVSLIMIDIDNFKKINDTFGHSKGDDILIDISKIINNRIRNTDTLYRYGGEEFVVVAVNTDLENALRVAEELRALIEGHTFIKNHPITVSLGLAELKKDESIKDCFSRSDKALYKAKTSGKNRSCTDK